MEVAVLAVRALLATVHGVQPVPLMTIVALAGSKFVPTMVIENCWFPRGVVGAVDKLVRVGAAPTVSGRLPEIAPVAVFWTATVKLPPPTVTGPVMDVALLAVRAEVATVHGVQLGPVITIVALAGSKFVPTTVRENCWLARGVVGTVERLVTDGPLPTVSGRVEDAAPLAVFWMATVNDPLPRVAGPVRDVTVFAVSALLATVHGVQPGPLITIWALAVSKFAPTTVSENCWLATGVAGTVERLVTEGGRTAVTVAAADLVRRMVAANAPEHWS
jgi:hypothetical protein